MSSLYPASPQPKATRTKISAHHAVRIGWSWSREVRLRWPSLSTDWQTVCCMHINLLANGSFQSLTLPPKSDLFRLSTFGLLPRLPQSLTLPPKSDLF